MLRSASLATNALAGVLLAGCNVPGGALAAGDATQSDAAVDAPDDVGVDVALADTSIDALDLDAFGDASEDAAELDADLDVGTADASDVGVDACASTDACDGVDDDCDGLIDEDGCEGCTRVEVPGVPSHVYLFCNDTQRNWDDASAWCEGLGYRLADVQTEREHSFVWMRAQAVRDDHWWIGLRRTDGWRWTRGDAAHPSEPTAYNGWMSGDPSDAEECGRMKKDADGVEATFTDGGWETKACTDNNFTVCEVGG